MTGLEEGGRAHLEGEGETVVTEIALASQQVQPEEPDIQ